MKDRITMRVETNNIKIVQEYGEKNYQEYVEVMGRMYRVEQLDMEVLEDQYVISMQLIAK